MQKLCATKNWQYEWPGNEAKSCTNYNLDTVPFNFCGFSSCMTKMTQMNSVNSVLRLKPVMCLNIQIHTIGRAQVSSVGPALDASIGLSLAWIALVLG